MCEFFRTNLVRHFCVISKDRKKWKQQLQPTNHPQKIVKRLDTTVSHFRANELMHFARWVVSVSRAHRSTTHHSECLQSRMDDTNTHTHTFSHTQMALNLVFVSCPKAIYHLSLLPLAWLPSRGTLGSSKLRRMSLANRLVFVHIMRQRQCTRCIFGRSNSFLSVACHYVQRSIFVPLLVLRCTFLSFVRGRKMEKWEWHRKCRHFLRHGSTQHHHPSTICTPLGRLNPICVCTMCSMGSCRQRRVYLAKHCSSIGFFPSLGTTKNGSRCIVVDQNKQFYFLVRSALSLSIYFFFCSHSVFPRSVLSFFMFGLFLPVCRQCNGNGKIGKMKIASPRHRDENDYRGLILRITVIAAAAAISVYYMYLWFTSI